MQQIGSLGRDYRHGAGVLDIHFDSAFTLLTCGYDTFVRLWDLRASLHSWYGRSAHNRDCSFSSCAIQINAFFFLFLFLLIHYHLLDMVWTSRYSSQMCWSLKIALKADPSMHNIGFIRKLNINI